MYTSEEIDLCWVRQFSTYFINPETVSMWSQNKVTERLNIDYPIFLAPMAELVTPELAAEVSNAGGLGALGMWGFTLKEGVKRIEQFRKLSSGSLNINFPLWDDPGDLVATGIPMRRKIEELYELNNLGVAPAPNASASRVSPDHLEALKIIKPEVVSFHFGLPSENIVEDLKSWGTYVVCSATTVTEAKYLAARGVDSVIAQGIEAGGHRGTFLDTDIGTQSGLFSLLPQVVDAVDVPVIAAGGISDGRGIAAAMMLGASGVQLGTAFLRCDEANVTDAYREGLRSAKEAGTIITDAVSGRNARFIKNTLVQELAFPGLQPLPFPAQYKLTLPLGESGDMEFTDLLSGQSVAMTREMPAEELVRTLVKETEDCINFF
jgi:nitronate monooxygenase